MMVVIIWLGKYKTNFICIDKDCIYVSNINSPGLEARGVLDPIGTPFSSTFLYISSNSDCVLVLYPLSYFSPKAPESDN